MTHYRLAAPRRHSVLHRDERENAFELVFLCIVVCLIAGVALHLIGIDLAHLWGAVTDLF